MNLFPPRLTHCGSSNHLSFAERAPDRAGARRVGVAARPLDREAEKIPKPSESKRASAIDNDLDFNLGRIRNKCRTLARSQLRANAGAQTSALTSIGGAPDQVSSARVASLGDS